MLSQKTNKTTLEALDSLVAACDAHHHYYHFQASWQHLCLAEALFALGRAEEARKHYKAALFQDHLNEWAKREKPCGGLPAYDSHITSNAAQEIAAFERGLGWEQGSGTEHCEQGERWLAQGDMERAQESFAEAVRLSAPRHDRYHRYASDMHVERGEMFLKTGELDLAIADFSKALDLNRSNMRALEARAGAYRQKGSERLALEDTQCMKHIAMSGT